MVSVAVFGLAILVFATAVWLLIGSLRRTRGLQRRLFLLLLATSLVPSLAVLVGLGELGRRSLELVDSPGLQDSLESGLRLARGRLELEKGKCRGRITQWVTSLRSDAAAPDSAGQELALLAAEGSRPALWPRDATSGRPTPQAEALAELWTGFDSADSASSGPRRVEIAGREYLLCAAPLLSGGREARLWLARPLDRTLSTDLAAIGRGSSGLRQLRLYYLSMLRSEMLLGLAGLSLLLLIVSSILSRLLARRVAGPVTELAEAARQIASGKRGLAIETPAQDELSDLVFAFREMDRQLLASEERMRRSERLAAWQGVARRLAHEIRNPLTAIRLSLHRLRDEGTSPRSREALDIILEETGNLQRLADEFSLFARSPRLRRGSVELRSLLDQVCRLYLGPTESRWSWEDSPATLIVDGDEGLLRQLFANLVKNAAEAMPQSGRLHLRAEVSSTAIRLEIVDEGHGLPEDPQRIFDPDFSTKASGSGLGLAIARRIAEDHGGRIGASAPEDGGSEFFVELPATGEGG